MEATRAIDNLYIFSPKSVKGNFKDSSPFIPISLVGNEGDEYYKSDFKKGQRVKSKTYGEGTVEDVTKDVVKVFFGDNTLRMFKIRVVVESNLLEILE